MKGLTDLRKETEDAAKAAAAGKVVEEDRDIYANTFEGGQLAVLKDVREAFKMRGGRDHINVLNEMVAYLDHRIDPEGCDLPDTPSGYPEARSAENPPEKTEGEDTPTAGSNPQAPKPV